MATDPHGPIYRGPLPDIDIPDVTLFDLVFGDLSPADADRVALLDHARGTALTFGEVKRSSEALATWLAARGIGPGDVVAIQLHNRPEYAVAFHGVARSGAASTPINTHYTAGEIAQMLTLTNARAIITEPSLLPIADAAAAEVGLAASDVIVLADDPAEQAAAGATDETAGSAGEEPSAAVGAVAWADVIATEPAPPAQEIDPATHVVCLPFSSGTSGLPKPVMLTHRNLVANMLQFHKVLEPLGEDASLVAFLPYSHIYALTTNLNYGLYCRSAQYTMAGFDPALFLQIIAVRRPAVLFVVPPVAAFLSRHPAVEKADLSSLRLIVSGAAPLDGPVGAALEQRLGVRVVQGYGMTELSPVTHVMPLDAPAMDHGSIGQAIPNVRFRVVDPETGQDVEPPAPGAESAPGELWCAGPNTMLGYLGAPDSDAVKDADGWVHTGDLVTVDSDGVVHVVDRIKELIKRRGMQIAPAELEALLASHPAVADAGVLGVPTRTAGEEVPHALVQLRAGQEATASELMNWVAERVAQHKRLAGLRFVDVVPRSAAGKILRRRLPELYAAAAGPAD